jgi:hypothetical protein
VKLVQINEEAKIAHRNAYRDGSIDYEKFVEIHGENEEFEIEEKMGLHRNSVQNNSTSNNVGNPVKEGLCDTSLKLLKVTLKMFKEDYLVFIKKENCSTLLMPVEVIIKQMYKHLCIQEHINQVCLGMHYRKDRGFFKTSTFNRLVKGFSLYTQKEEKEAKSDLNLSSINQSMRRNQEYKAKIDLDLLYWRNKLQNFMLESNEKWMLDQYNLIKRFCIENSIETQPSDMHFFKGAWTEMNHNQRQLSNSILSGANSATRSAVSDRAPRQ